MSSGAEVICWIWTARLMIVRVARCAANLATI